ncbi:hypothetical protein OLMES_2140 [Oleiphilus messinensis]|uniref:Uncharacterized protein n=1 Tax=Oleiphilus messinensis TaxID=141451 RepID=A0A1Y0I9Z4_9GAMM|nr:hypothetical protein OLMES_2140 [Oleiphilus messinensis]
MSAHLITYKRNLQLIPDPLHADRRRATLSYKRQKSLVKSLWILSSICMLLNPVPHIVIPIALFTSFISFCLLDEAKP